MEGGVVVPPDGGNPVTASCAGVVTQPTPPTNACTGDPAACLSGSAGTRGFATSPRHRCASVYRTFPQGTAQPVQTQIVAADDTWAFSGLPAWGHYYVLVVDDFSLPGAGASVAAIVGPESVPAALADGGASLQVQIKPVQLAALETKTAGGSWQVQWASAHVFDPASGAELKGSSQVAVVVGGQPTPMPWGPDPSGGSSYFVQFAQPPAAQASYAITTSDPALGSTPLTWTLLADPPSFDGAIAKPSDGAVVPANTPLTLSWSAQPAADFVLTELFAKTDAGAWTLAYTSPQPNDSSVTSETIPASDLPPGTYLLNLAFSRANCPASADGCVFANAIGVAQFTAQ
jgi:hypothetical protein